jgi:hypothetical protein
MVGAEITVTSQFGVRQETKKIEYFTKRELLKKLSGLIDKETTSVQIRIWRIE